MEAIIEAINRFFEFSSSGIFDFIHSLAVQLQYYFVIWSIKAKVFFLSVSWEVAKTLLSNFGISTLLNNAWSSFDSELVSYLTLLKVPEGLNIIIQAYITKFSMRLI